EKTKKNASNLKITPYHGEKIKLLSPDLQSGKIVGKGPRDQKSEEERGKSPQYSNSQKGFYLFAQLLWIGG
ncbi:hypothetical protein AKJ64_00985, partial [candidate division MSBL1 archaeon SCGC-AAA259E17]